MSPSAINLDSPVVQQTKTEIRSIATEIAKLAQAKISPSEFYEGFLTRLVSAMGATGAAIWRIEPNTDLSEETVSTSKSSHSFELLSGHMVPEALFSDKSASPTHARILECVVVEGQPLLVPPSSVKVDANRPINPLSDALIVVPVRVQDTPELIVEVIQRPSGGPSAQRGYLRFVAQMADLLTDFLRQHKLRELTEKQQFVELIEKCLSHIASQADAAAQQSVAIDCLRQLYDGEHAMLLSNEKLPRTVAIAGTGSFDPRSELVTTASKLVEQLQNGSLIPNKTFGSIPVFDARDRRNSETLKLPPNMAERLCDQLGCRRVVVVPLGNKQQFVAIVSYAEAEENIDLQLPAKPSSLDLIAVSVGALLERPLAESVKQKLLGILTGSTDSSPAGVRRTMIRRVALAVMLIALAFAPVPQKVTSNATLHPSGKQNYFAPMPATINRVWVREGDEVQANDVLLTLDCPSLNSRVLQLQAELDQVNDLASDLRDTIGKDNGLNPASVAKLDLQLHNYENQRVAIEDELQQRSSDLDGLTIRARTAGRVSSWGLENRLLGRPVVADDLLISTYQPDSDWFFQLAIPERRIGLVARTLENSDDTTQVSFLLSSFPDRVLVGELQKLGTQSVSSSVSFQSEKAERAVMARVGISSTLLPVRKDGVFATASIDCGHTPLIWLVIRDATCQLTSRIRMLW